MVEKKEVFRKIEGIINELNSQYEYLSDNQDKINELELGLFAANANYLAEHIKVIQKINGAKQTASSQSPDDVGSEAKKDETVEETGESEKKEENSPAVTVIEAPSVKDDHPVTEKSEDQKQQAEDAKAENPENDAVTKEVIITEKTISIDNPVRDKIPGEPVPTLNDLISAQRNQQTVSDNFSKKSVSDLKAIISMNDKLLFVKDLFNGYSLAYSEAIEVINRFDNFEAADTFLKKNYAAKNNWAEKQATVDKFYEILNRRFAK